MKKLIVFTAAALLLLSVFGGCSKLVEDYKADQSYKASRSQMLDEHKSKFQGRGYTSLKTAEEQDAYASIDIAANEDVSVTFDIPGGKVFENFNDILEFYKNDHPEVFWIKDDVAYTYIDRGATVSIELAFKTRGDELELQKAKLDKAIKDIISKAPVKGTEYEKELYINDWLVDNCEYDEDAVAIHKEKKRILANEQDVYGALVERKAVCEGYARAFQLLCTRLNVDCTIIEGYAHENTDDGRIARTAHAWNCVQLDGAWYHVDTTWNDNVDEAFKNVASRRYYYLNLTAREIERDHEISPLYGDTESSAQKSDYRNHFIPLCNTRHYNYFRMNCPTLTSIDKSSAIVNALTDAAKKKMTYFDFVVDPELDFNEIKTKISEGEGFKWIQESNKCNDNNHQLNKKCSLYAFEERGLITFLLYYEG
ncbi:MAG: transglutaminase domain-containing protein [Ruminococcus sp.]|nr:transglutaminase domain-containing protein [Ruminococcus sp.]